MSRRPSLLFDIACVALSVSEITSRAATIQSRRVLGERAVKRDWYGNEIGVKAADYSAEPRDGWAKEEEVLARHETAPPEFKSSTAGPSVSPFDTPPSAPKPPPKPSPKPTSAHAVRNTTVLSGALDEGFSRLPPATPIKPTASAPAEPTSLFNNTAAEAPPIPVEIPSIKDNLLLKASQRLEDASLPRHTSPPPLTRAPLADIEDDRPAPVMRASKVPSSALGRLFHYGSLTAGLATGAATEYIRRQTSGSSDPQTHSVMMSEANVTRLVNKLSQMRGAALKLGQFMSIQDAHVLPDQIEAILRRVQNAAHYMPTWQMEQVMSRELGENWKELFDEFDPIPMASASIGQVHKATLSPSSLFYPHNATGSGSTASSLPLAVKVQFPGVENSIVSDIRTISLLLSSTTSLLPKGVFLDKTIEVFKQELADECNYVREAESAVRFAEELRGDDRFKVPAIVGLNASDKGKSMTTKNVLVMERMAGTPLGAAVKWEQEVRDEIARNILVLCLRELFHFRFMQTDPNWSNFLYNRRTRQIELVDFGASREYSKEFMDRWYLLLKAAVEGDREAGIEQSLALGYLKGGENETMIDAHLQSLILLGKPFSKEMAQPFDFAKNDIPSQIRT
ncbi:hypothetical protein FRC00_003717, partial [Tulasnella sp. 408]